MVCVCVRAHACANGRVVFLVYLGCVSTCFLISTFYHIFRNHSVRAYANWLIADINGVGTYTPLPGASGQTSDPCVRRLRLRRRHQAFIFSVRCCSWPTSDSSATTCIAGPTWYLARSGSTCSLEPRFADTRHHTTPCQTLDVLLYLSFFVSMPAIVKYKLFNLRTPSHLYACVVAASAAFLRDRLVTPQARGCLVFSPSSASGHTSMQTSATGYATVLTPVRELIACTHELTRPTNMDYASP
jgi:hypothetical protein